MHPHQHSHMPPNNPRDPHRSSASLWSRLPLAGRALLCFWGLVAVGGIAGVGRLAWLGSKTTPPSAVAVPKVAGDTKMPPLPAFAAQTAKTEPPPKALPAVTGPHVSVVLGGFGYASELSERVLNELPPEIGLLVSPYLHDLPALIHRAKAAGHEVYLDLPVQGASPDDTAAGPHALGYGNGPAQDLEALRWNLERAPGIIGISVADTVQRDTTSAPGYAASPDFPPIANTIMRDGLLVLVNGDQRPGIARDLRSDSTIHLDADGPAITRALSQLTDRAIHGEYVLSVTDTVTPSGITALKAWSTDLAKQGITLVAPSRMLAPDSFVQNALRNAGDPT